MRKLVARDLNILPRTLSHCLGSITNEEVRTFEIPLAFLAPNRPYVAEIYADGPEADWADNPHSYRIDNFIVSAETVLQLRLAAGGGQAIRFRPATEADLSSLAEYQLP